MSADDTSPKPDDLQFDRVETETPRADANETSPEVTCTVCGKSVGPEYYNANGKPVCASCRELVTSAAQTPRSMGTLVRAGLFGVGAAIAGAAFYYGVIALTSFEIGLVAILIGFMVGWAVRKGAQGRGGRRFQVLALVLTYWSVGLAYTPLAIKGMREGASDSTSMTATDSTTSSTRSVDSTNVAPPVAATPPATDSASSLVATESTTPPSGRQALIGLGMIFLFVFALPVTYIVSSLPGGLLSALIIGIGLRQAWVMTGTPKLEISGPYKVGAGTSPAGG